VIQIVGSLFILGLLFAFGRDQIFKAKGGYLKPALFGMVIGGALGNLVDRVSQGYVADFIVLKPFPVFNVADIGITVGLSLLFLLFLLESKQ
jgi:signal peptidase II